MEFRRFRAESVRDTCFASPIRTVSAPPGLDVHNPPCFTQNVHVQARA